jgi:hypothetical protein
VVAALVNTQEFAALEDVEVTSADLRDRDGITMVLGSRADGVPATLGGQGLMQGVHAGAIGVPIRPRRKVILVFMILEATTVRACTFRQLCSLVEPRLLC